MKLAEKVRRERVPIRNILVSIPLMPFLLYPWLRRHRTFCVDCRDKNIREHGDFGFPNETWWRCYFLGHSLGGKSR